MPKSKSQTKRVFISDCEGPISINDNAFELTASFIDAGDRFFTLISKYDDVLVDIVKRSDYKAGDTLRLILPFLKAYGATDKNIKNFSSRNILLVPGAEDMLHFVMKLLPSFVVSTSYEHYISALCKLIGFPFENTYYTRLNMDKYQISELETKRVRDLAKEIAMLPLINIPKNANSMRDFPYRDQEIVRRLDKIFWEELPKMESGRMLREVNPIGGTEKAKAVKNIVEMMGCSLDGVMYVGDSITDVEALKLVRKNGGLAVSFNGNRYSVQESDVAFLSGNTVVTSVFAEVFYKLGKKGALNLVSNWNPSGLKKYCSPLMYRKMLRIFGDIFPQVELVTDDNLERLIGESSVFRKSVRGETIARLG